MPTIQQINIIPYARPYLPAMLALFARTVRTVNAADYSAAEIAAWLRNSAADAEWHVRFASTKTLLALHADTLVGFGNVAPGAHLDMLYVDALVVHQGVGTALTAALEESARVWGDARIEADASITARPFFERRGYKVVRKQFNQRDQQVLVNYHMQTELLPEQ